MAESENNYEYPYEELGKKEVNLEGNTFEGRFVGRGYVTGNYDAGFLSDVKFDEEPAPEDEDTPQKRLTISGLFPRSWRNVEGQTVEPYVEYEITIKARKIAPPEKEENDTSG